MSDPKTPSDMGAATRTHRLHEEETPTEEGMTKTTQSNDDNNDNKDQITVSASLNQKRSASSAFVEPNLSVGDAIDRTEHIDVANHPKCNGTMSTTQRWLDIKRRWNSFSQIVSTMTKTADRHNHNNMAQYLDLYNFLQAQLEELPPRIDKSASCHHSICKGKAELFQTNAELLAAITKWDNAQKELQNLENAVISSTNDHEHQTIVSLHQKILSEKLAIVSSIVDGISTTVDCICTDIAIVVTSHESTKILLSGATRAANETYVSDRTPPSSERSEKDTWSIHSEDYFSPSELDKLLIWPKTGNYATRHQFSDLPEKTRNSISEFSVFLNNLVRKSNIIPLEEDNCMHESKIASTVNCILNWKPGQEEVDPAAASYFLPSSYEQETKGVHPILHAILRTLAKICCHQNIALTESEQAKIDQQSKSDMDFVFTASSESELEKPIVPGRLGLVAEVKPVKRKGKDFEKLTLQGANQVLGNLAKHLLTAFALGGIGADRKVRGLVFTLASVEVVELELHNMGSREIDVTKRTSGKLPLFHLDEISCTKLFGDDALPKSLSYSSTTKYPAEGLKLLAVLLASSHETAISCTGKVTSPCCGTKEINLRDFLGSGAFAVVYTLRDESNVFIKIPMGNNAIEHLKREVNALEMLDHSSIPKLMETHADHFSTLQFTGHCLSSEQKGLCLTGIVGIPAWIALGKMSFATRSSALCAICLQIREALDYAHQQTWAHLDIRPDNCIVRLCDNVVNKIQVLLIDWGCAARINENIGFRGCIPFAHKELLQKGQKNWLANAEFDFASLTYTIASLSQSPTMEQNPSIPWEHFTERGMEEHFLLKRDETTKNLLERTNLDAGLRSTLLSYISEGKREPMLGQKRKLNDGES